MDGVAERVEDRGNVQINAWAVLPDIRHWQRDILGKCAGAVDADAGRVFTQMPPPRQAVAAAATDNMTLATDNLAGKEVGDIRADFDNLADKLMPNDQRHRNGLLRPRIPVVDMQVRSADARALDTDQNVIDADTGLGNLFQPQARLGPCFY